jgi:hypothetical protein
MKRTYTGLLIFLQPSFGFDFRAQNVRSCFIARLQGLRQLLLQSVVSAD